MREIRFSVPGEPMGKERPLLVTCKSHPYAITRQKTRDYEQLVKDLFATGSKKGEYLFGPVKAEINVYYAVPKSISKKKTAKMLCGEILPTKKPDCDNVAKIILDSLNGLAYKDDAYVTELIVTKAFSEVPRVDITLSEVEGMPYRKEAV